MQKQRAHYPFVNLEKALGRAEEIFDADPSGRPMSLSAAFDVWSYSIKSSGGLQTVSALKAYGLLEDYGAKEDRKVGLTDKALQYFKDEREEKREALLREFATLPKLFRQLWEDSGWGSSPPSDSVARSHLKVDLGLSEQASRSILGIYKDNIAFANFTGDDTVPNVNDDADCQFSVGDLVNWESAGQLQWKDPKTVIGIDNHEDGRRFYKVDGLGELAGSPGWIPMEQAVEHREAPGQNRNIFAPPADDRLEGDAKGIDGDSLSKDERVLARGLLSKDASFKLVVSGSVGPQEIDRLISKLELDRDILASSDD